MNYSHLHLLFNHLALIGIPFVTLFLFYGFKTRNPNLQRFALAIIMFLAITVLPTYFTGEPAEELVEHLPGVSEVQIEPHEESAQVTLLFTVIMGICAGAALLFQKNEKLAQMATIAVLLTSLLTTLSLAYTGNLGGKIRHTEVR